jgi:hypothetical protein
VLTDGHQESVRRTDLMLVWEPQIVACGVVFRTTTTRVLRVSRWTELHRGRAMQRCRCRCHEVGPGRVHGGSLKRSAVLDLDFWSLTLFLRVRRSLLPGPRLVHSTDLELTSLFQLPRQSLDCIVVAMVKFPKIYNTYFLAIVSTIGGML